MEKMWGIHICIAISELDSPHEPKKSSMSRMLDVPHMATTCEAQSHSLLDVAPCNILHRPRLWERGPLGDTKRVMVCDILIISNDMLNKPLSLSRGCGPLGDTKRVIVRDILIISSTMLNLYVCVYINIRKREGYVKQFLGVCQLTSVCIA